MKKTIFGTLTAMMVAMLVLTACNLPISASNTSTPSADSSMDDTNTSTVAPAASGNCLIGTWNLTDFGPYMDSIKQNISANSDNNVTFTSGSFSGAATFEFNADNTTTLKMDNFTQSFTMTMKVSDASMDIPITMTVNGFSSAEYTVDGDQITFSNQNPGDMKVNIEMSGNTSTMDQNMFGDPGTQKLYQYSCTDANTLSLKVIAVESMDLAPLILTRAQ